MTRAAKLLLIYVCKYAKLLMVNNLTMYSCWRWGYVPSKKARDWKTSYCILIRIGAAVCLLGARLIDYE